MLNLELTSSIQATKFISDFKDCLTRLRKVKAKLANDNETLRALLLLAIQDQNFDPVRDEILKSPTKTIEDLLTDLQERDSSLAIRDASHTDLSGDGRMLSRRSVTFDDDKKNKNHNKFQKKEWRIPYYPNGWRDAVGPKLFKVLCSWRSDAIKGLSQHKLNSTYDLKVEGVKPKEHGNGGKNKRKIRHVSKDKEKETESDVEEETFTPPKRSCIRLAKTNDIVTERNI